MHRGWSSHRGLAFAAVVGLPTLSWPELRAGCTLALRPRLIATAVQWEHRDALRMRLHSAKKVAFRSITQYRRHYAVHDTLSCDGNRTEGYSALKPMLCLMAHPGCMTAQPCVDPLA